MKTRSKVVCDHLKCGRRFLVEHEVGVIHQIEAKDLPDGWLYANIGVEIKGADGVFRLERNVSACSPKHLAEAAKFAINTAVELHDKAWNPDGSQKLKIMPGTPGMPLAAGRTEE